MIESDDEDDGLQLQKRELSCVPADVAKKEGPSTISLDLTSNELKSGENLELFVNLRTLILDHNKLSTLEPFPMMEKLETLWLNNNEFADVGAVTNEIRDRYPNLTYLSLLRNPLCPNLYFDQGNEEKYQRYRMSVICRLPKLESLDALPVTPGERERANRVGQFLVVAKAKYENPEDHDESAAVDQESVYKDVKLDQQGKPAAYLGRGKIKYDGRQSEGNRFIGNESL